MFAVQCVYVDWLFLCVHSMSCAVSLFSAKWPRLSVYNIKKLEAAVTVTLFLNTNFVLCTTKLNIFDTNLVKR